jgi:hypothetical protein
VDGRAGFQIGKVAMNRLALCIACSLSATTACGGREVYDDFRASGGAWAVAVGGNVSSSGHSTSVSGVANGGIANSGIANGGIANGGVSSLGNGQSGADGIAGAAAGSVNCSTVDLQTMAHRVPLCTFPPPIRPDVSDCQNSPVKVYREQSVTYLAGAEVLQCADGSMAEVVFDQVGSAYHSEKAEIVTGQVLTNGLVRLTCTAYDAEDYYWDYSTNGLQTLQPYPKAGGLYVEFPEGEVAASGYEGRLDGYARCTPPRGYDCANANITYTLNSGDHASMGTKPVTFSADGKTLWFDDMNGRKVTISIDDDYHVIDVQR